MTERDDERSDLLPDGVPPFDDTAYDDLRGLLADARVTEPMPAEVADRLDTVLAGLKSESTVVPLAPRRRRAGARLLTAAAVVIGVVGGGYGLSQVVGPGGGNDDKAMSGAASDRAAKAPEGTAGGSVTNGLDSVTTIPRVRKSAFAGDATAVLASQPETLQKLKRLTELSATASGGRPEVAPTPSPSSTTTDPRAPFDYAARDQDLRYAMAALCVAPDLPGTTAYPIVLDGRLAVLVVHPVANGQRLVQAWRCDGKKVLATAAVPG